MLSGVRTEAQWGIAPGISTPSSGNRETHLECLLKDVAREAAGGRFSAALRLADRARRLAPQNPFCAVLCARLLLQVGRAPEAVELLKGQEEPEAVVARGEAFCSLGQWDQASACCDSLLSGFAVDAVEDIQHLASQICQPQSGLLYPGWIGIDSRLRLIGEVRKDAPLDIRLSNEVYEPSKSTESDAGLISFVCELPAGVSGQVQASSGDALLLGSGLAWPPDFDLSAWAALEGAALVGEARLGWWPAQPLSIEIAVDEGQPRQAVISPTPGANLSPFSFPLEPEELEAAQIDVAAVLPDGSRQRLAGSPIAMRSRPAQPIGPQPGRLIAENRDAERKAQGKIDIVIPIYAGFEETLACIESLLASIEEVDAEVIVVDDASPDPALRETMTRLARDGRITLLTNAENLGFPGAANRGIRLHPDRDVVLLNSDTEVFGDWLSQLRNAADSANDIATVTPLCERDSITEYSRNAESAGPLASAAEINRIAQKANLGKVIEIPVGVGFCLYIKRECLNEIGELDETTFGKGYGEESDLCLRARQRGWRHVAATGLLVSHRGGRSFGRRKRELLLNRSRSVLNALHPGYAQLVAELLSRDPLLDSRRAIDMRILIEQAVRPVLLLTLELHGGVRRHVNQREAHLSAAGHTAIVLRPAETDGKVGRVKLHVESLGLKNLCFDLPGDSQLLRELLASLNLSHVEIHHFFGMPAEALEMATALGVPYVVYVHDYLWICPRVTLIGGTGTYCGEPPVSECENCIRRHGSALDASLTVQGLRARSARILSGADRVIAPTHDTRERLARYFPEVQVSVVPWETGIEPARQSGPAPQDVVRVAVIGAIGIQKGHHVLLDCARDAAQRHLDLEFVVIGYSIDDEALMATGKVFVTGPYDEGEADRLLEREQCHVAFFPSVWPETWCYSLTHALSFSLPVLAFDHGALAERLRTYISAKLIPLSTTAERMNDSLLELSNKSAHAKVRKEAVMDQSSLTLERPPSAELTSSVQILTLPQGIYAFTIQGGAEPGAHQQGLALPALQVSLAPSRTSGRAHFLTGAMALDRWLVYSTDMLVVRIDNGDASLMLNSVRIPDSPVLGLNVNRLNAEPSSLVSGSPVTQTEEGERATSPQVSLHVHVKNVGDLEFQDCWAGWLGQRLWIEAFSVAVSGLSGGDTFPADAIEYCAVTAEGSQTPWHTNQEICGTLGAGIPLLGFGVRLTPEAAEKYDCIYGGKFFSGATVGPLNDGILCRSAMPGDPLEGIVIHITERSTHVAPPQEVPQYNALEA
jgi:GT2 family glycosyltransferase/glycosyltransferase involved in cell wall biosynthesis